jgi:uncharacterized membrane protein
MDSLSQLLFLAAGDAHGLARTHGDWMAWNLLLAFIPVLFALALFQPGSRRTFAWWSGVAIFVLFLPNAPYVISDIIHLFEDIREARSDLQVLAELVPLYVGFFVIGFLCYVVALDRLGQYLRTERPGPWWWRAELALQFLCAVGVYLGRVVRLNSWQVFTRPRQMLALGDWLIGGFPIMLIVATFVVLIVGTTLTRAVMYSVIRWVEAFRRPLGSTA